MAEILNKPTQTNTEKIVRTFEFTIKGNAVDANGNPLPKARLTKRQQWTSKAKNYVAWKQHVQKALTDSMFYSDRVIANKNIYFHVKPVRLYKDAGQRGHMAIKIYWRNHVHGDPENIFGSIADALFCDDKNLDGSFESASAEDRKGRVEVKIIIKSEKDCNDG